MIQFKAAAAEIVYVYCRQAVFQCRFSNYIIIKNVNNQKIKI